MPDLQTNLRLNDAQFREGLRAAEGALGKFDNRLKAMSRTSEMVGKALKLGGAAELVNQVVSSFDRAIDAQQRLIDGAASFRDRWDDARGSIYQAAGMLPFIGKSIQDIAFHLQDGTEAVTRMAGDQGLSRLRRETTLHLRLLEAATKEEKRRIQIEDQRLKRMEEMNRLAAMTKQDTRDIAAAINKAAAIEKKGESQFKILQAGQITGSEEQLTQFFGGTSNGRPASQVTSPGSPGLPQPGPTTPPAAVKAQEDTARNTKETASLLSRLVNRPPTATFS